MPHGPPDVVVSPVYTVDDRLGNRARRHRRVDGDAGGVGPIERLVMLGMTNVHCTGICWCVSVCLCVCVSAVRVCVGIDLSSSLGHPSRRCDATQ